MTGKNRRTLKYIQYYPSPNELYQKITSASGWNYKTNMEFYQVRDRALASLIYLLGGRISEILRLKKNQFLMNHDKVIVRGIKLSKSRYKNRPRREQFREEAWLPLHGERAGLTLLVLDYLRLVDADDVLLFPFSRQRAWQIVGCLLGVPCHWLRAYCENYLYDNWGKDILAVSDYVKVDPRTLQLYIRRSYQKYKPV
jgi:integrase